MKAHSARVTSKNFREIAGKPLFRWVLDTLSSVEQISQIVINTDAKDLLAERGLEEGDYSGKVIVRDRKAEICGDLVSMNLVLADDVTAIEADAYFMTHTTNPLLSAKTIGKMIEAYRLGISDGSADSLFTVNKLQTRFYRSDGAPINHDPNNLLRTQDLEPYFEENSVGYLFSRSSFQETQARIGERPIMFETPPLESVDIDEPEDWFMAEALLLRVARGEALPERAV